MSFLLGLFSPLFLFALYDTTIGSYSWEIDEVSIQRKSRFSTKHIYREDVKQIVVCTTENLPNKNCHKSKYIIHYKDGRIYPLLERKDFGIDASADLNDPLINTWPEIPVICI